MDWKKMINEVLETGLTKVRIAKAIGLPPPSIYDILMSRQKSIRWEVGNALILLHKNALRKHKK